MFTQGTDRKWFKKMGGWKVVYLGFREVTAKLGIVICRLFELGSG